MATDIGDFNGARTRLARQQINVNPARHRWNEEQKRTVDVATFDQIIEDSHYPEGDGGWKPVDIMVCLTTGQPPQQPGPTSAQTNAIWVRQLQKDGSGCFEFAGNAFHMNPVPSNIHYLKKNNQERETQQGVERCRWAGHLQPAGWKLDSGRWRSTSQSWHVEVRRLWFHATVKVSAVEIQCEHDCRRVCIVYWSFTSYHKISLYIHIWFVVVWPCVNARITMRPRVGNSNLDWRVDPRAGHSMFHSGVAHSPQAQTKHSDDQTDDFKKCHFGHWSHESSHETSWNIMKHHTQNAGEDRSEQEKDYERLMVEICGWLSLRSLSSFWKFD